MVLVDDCVVDALLTLERSAGLKNLTIVFSLVSVPIDTTLLLPQEKSWVCQLVQHRSGVAADKPNEDDGFKYEIEIIIQYEISILSGKF